MCDPCEITKRCCLPPNHDGRFVDFLGRDFSLENHFTFLGGKQLFDALIYLEHIRNKDCSGREVLRPTKMSSVHRCLMPNAAAA